MDFIKILMKGVHAEDLIKTVATHAAASAVKGPLSELFQKMKSAGRTKLAGQLRSIADHIEAGECDAAASVGGEIVDGIKFNIPGL